MTIVRSLHREPIHSIAFSDTAFTSHKATSGKHIGETSRRDEQERRADGVVLSPPEEEQPSAIMLGLFPEFETNLRRVRQFEGVRLRSHGIAKALDIGRASVRRVLRSANDG
jgi:hypothetical protein